MGNFPRRPCVASESCASACRGYDHDSHTPPVSVRGSLLRRTSVQRRGAACSRRHHAHRILQVRREAVCEHQRPVDRTGPVARRHQRSAHSVPIAERQPAATQSDPASTEPVGSAGLLRSPALHLRRPRLRRDPPLRCQIMGATTSSYRVTTRGRAMRTKVFQQVSFQLPRTGKLKVAERIGRECGKLWFSMNRESLPADSPAQVRAWSPQARHAWHKGLAEAWHAERERAWRTAFSAGPVKVSSPKAATW